MYIATNRASASVSVVRAPRLLAALLAAPVLGASACSVDDRWTGADTSSAPSYAPIEAAADARFGEGWRDGRAEVSGYRLTVTRYGVARTGNAAMIFVTEPFSEGAGVKSGKAAGSGSDAVEVMKLNFSRDFQTGIYPYHTMTSAFLRTADFAPVKVAFSSTEWCGQVYHQLVFRGREVRQWVASYFEGESTSTPLPAPPLGTAPPITEDTLFISLRGLAGALLEAGERRVVQFLPGLFWARLTHAQLAWTTAEISRDPEPVQVEVLAGQFVCERYRVAVADGRVGQFEVEQAHPRRIIRWSWISGDGEPYESADSGELIGSDRVKYWERNQPGGEDALNGLGLSPIAPGA